MRDQLQELLALASRSGATYADLRLGERQSQPLILRNGMVQSLTSSSDQGIGIRVIVDGGWGFASTPSLEMQDWENTVRQAIAIAKASASSKLKDISLTPLEPADGKFAVKVEKDPFQVPLDEMTALLQDCHAAMIQLPEIAVTTGHILTSRNQQIFASTEGAWIEQEITQCGAGIEAYARGNHDMQRRSWSDYKNAGFEAVEAMHLVETASQLAADASALLKAEVCPKGCTDLIMNGAMAALQVHESCGHPVELDRVLGSESTYAGTSFLTPDLYGKHFRYGSDAVNIVADATIPDAMGSFFYDDEGVPAQRTPIIDHGIFTNYLTSRETAGNFGLTSNGTMRAVGWMNLPLVRMTNINLEPGDWTTDEIIRDTKKGVFVFEPKSWSLDDKRMNFHFGSEMAYEIVDGEIGRLLKNPAYTALTPEFWGSCDAVAGKGDDEWRVWGMPGCAKGEPIQVINVGHGAAPARFRKVKVGVGE